MSRTLQFRRLGTATLANTTGANGELIINSTTKTLTVHDGVTPGGFVVTGNTTSSVDQFARNTANSATSLAQSAYNYANTIVSDTQIDQFARNTANTALDNITILQGVNLTQNTNITNATSLAQSAYNYANTIVSDTQIDPFARQTANAAFNKANVANDLAQSAYNYANTINVTNIDQYARNTANAATNNITVIQGVNNTQNTNITNAVTLAQNAYNNSNTKFSSSGGQITGNVIIVGDLDVTDNTIVSNAMEANNVIIDGTLLTGLAARTSVVLPHLIAQFASNSATYVQTNSQNINPEGSADWVITADNGTDTDYFLDLGLKGSQSNDQLLRAYDGYLTVQGSTIGQAGGNLIVGTTSSYPGLETKFVAGGYDYNNIVMRLGTYGANIVGDLTVTGQIIGPTINAINQFAQAAFNQANTGGGLTANSVATLSNKTFDVSVGSNNIFSIQGQSITSYSGSGQVAILQNSPTISVLNLSDSQLNLDGGTGSLYWSGQSGVAQAGDLKAGVYSSDPLLNNSLFTFGGAGANNMSVGIEGSLFIGTTLPSNNGGLNTTYPGWLVVQSGAKFGGTINTLGALQFDDPATGKIIFTDFTEQTTAYQNIVWQTANSAANLAQAAFDAANTANGGVTGNISIISTNSAINFVANSSGDNLGASTIEIVPDTNLTGTDQYLIIDPTAPGHIHIRAGGTQDSSSAELFLGGENSYVKVGAGFNPPVTIKANTYSWDFDVNGDLAAPGKIYLNNNNQNVLTLDRFGIRANTQMVLSAENFATGNNSSILFDKNGSGIVFRLEDTTPVSKNWGFYQNSLLFPDSSSQTTAYTGIGTDQYARDTANTAATTIPQNPQSTGYTLQSSDAGKHLYYTNNSAVSLYIPWTANTAWANGTTITIISNTTSNVSVTPNNGVSLYLAGNTTSASRNVTTYGMATLIMTAANTWYINGTGVI